MKSLFRFIAMKFLSVVALIAMLCRSHSLTTLPARRCLVRSQKSAFSALRAIADDDDERPKLSMREENDGPTMSVKSFDEIKIGAAYTTPKEISSAPQKVTKPSVSFGKGVFGSMSVEDLKSRGFVRESVQKVIVEDQPNRTNQSLPLLP